MSNSPRRPRWPMPIYFEEALVESGLMDTYRQRPPYQQNDYVSWVSRAKRPETRQKRLQQMLAELRAGDVYMKMEWRDRKR